MRQFTCYGNLQSVCFNRLDDDNGPAIRHELVGGGTLWELHGAPDGYVSDDVELSPGDWVLCCYPRRVKQRFPFAAVACDYHDGVVKACYGHSSRERGMKRYTVTCEPCPL